MFRRVSRDVSEKTSVCLPLVLTLCGRLTVWGFSSEMPWTTTLNVAFFLLNMNCPGSKSEPPLVYFFLKKNKSLCDRAWLQSWVYVGLWQRLQLFLKITLLRFSDSCRYCQCHRICLISSLIFFIVRMQTNLL